MTKISKTAAQSNAAIIAELNEDAASLQALTVTVSTDLSDADISALEILDADPISATEAPGETETLPEAPVVPVAPADDAPQAPLEDLVKAVSPEAVTVKITEITSAFDTRAAFETLHGAANSSIQDKLKGEVKRMALPGIAALMIATRIDANFLNREINAGKRFNIYAVAKLNDILHGLNSGHFKNAINIAVMKSMFKFRAAGMAFNGLAVLGAASDKVKVDRAMNAHLVRYTVSAATAPTQSSSTMNALQTIGAVVNKGTVKFPIWELTDAPVTKKLEALMLAA